MQQLGSRGLCIHTFDHADQVNAACFYPDGTVMLTRSRDGTAKLLGPSWGILGSLGAVLGLSWAVLGRLGAVLGGLGAI